MPIDLPALINAGTLASLRNDTLLTKAQQGATVPTMMRLLQNEDYQGLGNYFDAIQQHVSQTGETPLPETLQAWAPFFHALGGWRSTQGLNLQTRVLPGQAPTPGVPAQPGTTIEQAPGPQIETPGQAQYGMKTIPGWTKPPDVGPTGRQTPGLNYPGSQEAVATGETESSGPYYRREPIVTGGTVPTPAIPPTPGTPDTTVPMTTGERYDAAANWLLKHPNAQSILGPLMAGWEKRAAEETISARPFKMNVEGNDVLVTQPFRGGPPTFMSPIGGTGQYGVIDPQSDLYQKSILAYQTASTLAKSPYTFHQGTDIYPPVVQHGPTVTPTGTGLGGGGLIPNLNLAEAILGKAQADPAWAAANPAVVKQAEATKNVNLQVQEVKVGQMATAQAEAAARVARTIPQTGRLEDMVDTDTGSPIEPGQSMTEIGADLKSGKTTFLRGEAPQAMYRSSLIASKEVARMRGLVNQVASDQPFDQFITFKGGTIFGDPEMASAIGALRLQAGTLADALVRGASGGVARNTTQVNAISALVSGDMKTFFTLVPNKSAMLGVLDTANQLLNDQQDTLSPARKARRGAMTPVPAPRIVGPDTSKWTPVPLTPGGKAP